MCERGKDDVEFCGSRDSDLTGFGEGKKSFSLLQVLIYTSRKPMRCMESCVSNVNQ